jgi:hypothetical protein
MLTRVKLMSSSDDLCIMDQNLVTFDMSVNDMAETLSKLSVQLHTIMNWMGSVVMTSNE